MKRVPHLIALCLITLSLASCQSQMADPAPGYTGAPRDSAQLAYELSGKTWCTNDDACSLVLCMVQGQDTAQNFQQRIAALNEMGITQTNWNLAADDNVTKGTLGYMICRALDIPGGVMFQITNDRRYAYREALYHDLIERGSEYEPLTGPEAVGIMSRVARFENN
ncbi:MAG: hypothetical protein JW936_02445 [Sedimentisphaerales bacterium]|nr:hypothetical protein [Sedimentisphaerales bacterium]